MSESEYRKAFAEFLVGQAEIGRKFEAEFGEPYPRTLNDWKQWLARADVPGRFLPADKVASGHWTARELFPFIQGYLRRLKDAAPEGANTGDSGVPGDKIEKPPAGNEPPIPDDPVVVDFINAVRKEKANPSAPPKGVLQIAREIVAKTGLRGRAAEKEIARIKKARQRFESSKGNTT